MQWMSDIQVSHGQWRWPPWHGTRVLMMPFHLQDIAGTIPAPLHVWISVLECLRDASPCREGTAYLTIDERMVRAGHYHRRPGLHVDGWPDDGASRGVWGRAFWASPKGDVGMLMAASHRGSVAWRQPFIGAPRPFGDCEHLRDQCADATLIPLDPGSIYHCGALTVHEAIPVASTCARQFIRLSLPSDGAWPVSCTPNPLGIRPGHGICEARPAHFTAYQPQHANAIVV